MSYEIHPETPLAGVALTDRFPASSIHAMFERLQDMGRPYGVKFGEASLLSNSRLALEASEFARDKGKFHSFHSEVFRAYFTDGKDIGSVEVVLELGQAVGLDRQELKQALDEGTYATRLTEAQEAGREYGVTGTPTFIINDQYKVVGAQPLEVFRDALRQIQSEERF